MSDHALSPLESFIDRRFNLLDRRLEQIDKTIQFLGDRLMATLAEISAKADSLQEALDAEQVQIKAAVDSLTEQITTLQGMIADGGTAEERQAVLDKLNATLADLQATIPDA